MTDVAGTPAAPTAPAAAPAGQPTTTAPAAPSTPAAPLSREAARSSILQDARTNGEQLLSSTAAPAAPAAVAAPAAGSPAPSAAPDANASTDTLEIHPESGPSPELGSLKLRFKGEGGQYAPVPQGLASQKFELEVGGKTYVKDLAGISRLAADGIANARHANENHQIRTSIIPQLEQRHTSLQQQLDAQIALNREILMDEARYAARRQEFSELNSPEQRAVRAESALEERDRRESVREQSQQHVAYYQSTVLPALSSVFQEAPTVTNEEVMGRIALETSNLLVNGVVPPENYPKFVDYLSKNLAPWAKGLHAQRGQADTARKEAEQAAETQRRRDAQAALNTDVGRTFAPATTTNAPVASIAPSQSPPRSRAEARRQILESASQMG